MGKLVLRLVIMESPYRGPDDETIADNISFARACMRDCFRRGEAPFASHLLYTQPGILRDEDRQERVLGVEAGLLWSACAEVTVVYTDRGISEGMQHGIENAHAVGRRVEFRRLREPDHGTT
jgi:hypothetical protein